MDRAVRRTARRPSDAGTPRIQAGALFGTAGRDAADFGTAVHRLFAQVDWAGPGTPGALAAWADFGAAGVEALGCVGAPELAGVWERPEESGRAPESWRERGFEVVLDGEWVTGVFDRVVVSRDSSGRVLRAAVFDFKTDRVTGEAEIAAAVVRYAGQLKLYRAAVGRLTGLDTADVSCELVFTHPRRRIPLPAG
jgi:ATP-dependent helicase/nuclease subunit A